MTERIDLDSRIKEIPDIKAEEDIPFPIQNTHHNTIADQKLDKTDDLNKKISL